MFRSLYHYVLYRSQPFVWTNLLFLLVLFGIRVLETVLIRQSHPGVEFGEESIAVMVLNDLVFFFLCMVVITPVYLLIHRFHPVLARIFNSAVLFVITFVALGTSVYFSMTMVPLSADLFGYSFGDVQETVFSSGGINGEIITALIVILAAVGAVPMVAKKLPMPPLLAGSFYTGVVLSLPISLMTGPLSEAVVSPRDEYLVLNKSRYLIDRSVTFTMEKIFRLESSWEKEYPLLRKNEMKDVLGPHFKPTNTRPNLVFIIVEGLGASMMGGNTYGGFMPFLDSLSHQGLYWENFLSTTGRTFGVLPSLFGSLPYGDKGFMEMGPDMPDHLSLFSLLKNNGYYTTFYYGGKSNFDKQDVFLEYQGIDRMVDDRFFPPPYEKAEAAMNGFSWGYADKDLFQRSLEIIGEQPRTPRMDVYLTLSTHEPFIPPEKEKYLSRFRELLDTLSVDEEKKTDYRSYRDIFATLLYTDDALHYFISQYQKLPEYANTIFFITGDHRLIPVPQSTKIDRFHVPFIVFSPMLKGPKKFLSVSTHADVVPSLLSFLGVRYQMQLPQHVHWMGTGIDTASEFRNIHSYPLMRNKNELIDYIDGNHYYAEGKLFSFTNSLHIEETDNDSIAGILAEKLKIFSAMNSYVCRSNRLYPYRPYKNLVADKIDYDAVYRSLNIARLNSDAQFKKAQQLAFEGKFVEARAICRALLAISPSYHDVRTLLGRTYSWDHHYDAAREILNDVRTRAPNYADGYVAAAQVEYWSSNPETALVYVDRALLLDSLNIESVLLKGKILRSMRRDSAAMSEIGRVLRIDPVNAQAIEIKASFDRKGME